MAQLNTQDYSLENQVQVVYLPHPQIILFSIESKDPPLLFLSCQ